MWSNLIVATLISIIVRPRGYRFVTGPLTAVPLRAAIFDFALCPEDLEHIPDDNLAVRELRRVPKEGGWLLVTVPTPPAAYDSDHVREGYTRAQLERLMADGGFEVVDTGFCMHSAFKLLMRLFGVANFLFGAEAA